MARREPSYRLRSVEGPRVNRPASPSSGTGPHTATNSGGHHAGLTAPPGTTPHGQKCASSAERINELNADDTAGLRTIRYSTSAKPTAATAVIAVLRHARIRSRRRDNFRSAPEQRAAETHEGFQARSSAQQTDSPVSAIAQRVASIRRSGVGDDL